LGYYTGVRCSISTLFATVFEQGSAADILLNESLPMWSVSQDNVAAIQAWLQQQLSYEEQNVFLNNTVAPARAAVPSALPQPPPVAITLRNALEQALNLLDNAESIDHQWQQGDIEVRLHILTAKQSLLHALAAAVRTAS
jgi:hypothetical protein